MVAKLKDKLDSSIKQIEEKHKENISELSKKIYDEYTVKLEKTESDLLQAQTQLAQSIENEMAAEQEKNDLANEVLKIKAEMDDYVKNNKEHMSKLELNLTDSQQLLESKLNI